MNIENVNHRWNAVLSAVVALTGAILFYFTMQLATITDQLMSLKTEMATISAGAVKQQALDSLTQTSIIDMRQITQLETNQKNNIHRIEQLEGSIKVIGDRLGSIQQMLQDYGPKNRH